jgi:hypothetical protein
VIVRDGQGHFPVESKNPAAAVNFILTHQK